MSDASAASEIAKRARWIAKAQKRLAGVKRTHAEQRYEIDAWAREVESQIKAEIEMLEGECAAYYPEAAAVLAKHDAKSFTLPGGIRVGMRTSAEPVVKINDEEALRAAIDETLADVMLEPKPPGISMDALKRRLMTLVYCARCDHEADFHIPHCTEIDTCSCEEVIPVEQYVLRLSGEGGVRYLRTGLDASLIVTPPAERFYMRIPGGPDEQGE